MAGNRLSYGLRGVDAGASLGSAIGGALGGPVGATAGSILGGVGGFAVNALAGGKGAMERQEAKLLKSDMADMRAGKLGLDPASREQLVGQAAADIGRQTGAAQRQVSRDALAGGDPAAYTRAQRAIAEAGGAPIAKARADVNDLSRRIAESRRADIMKRMGIAVGEERQHRAATAENLVAAGESLAKSMGGADSWLVDLLNSRGRRNAAREGTDPKARVDPTRRGFTTRAEYDLWAGQGADTPIYDSSLDAIGEDDVSTAAAPAPPVASASEVPAADDLLFPEPAAEDTGSGYRSRIQQPDEIESDYDPASLIPGIGGSSY